MFEKKTNIFLNTLEKRIKTSTQLENKSQKSTSDAVRKESTRVYTSLRAETPAKLKEMTDMQSAHTALLETVAEDFIDNLSKEVSEQSEKARGELLDFQEIEREKGYIATNSFATTLAVAYDQKLNDCVILIQYCLTHLHGTLVQFT